MISMDKNKLLFYKNVMALIIPIALQNLINVGVTAADVIMLGKVGEKVLSGASLAGQVQFIMTLLFAGITSGANVLTAQYWGKKDTTSIEKVLGIGLLIGTVTAAIFSGLALLIPGGLMKIYSSDPEVIAQGIKYLQVVGISYVFMAITQVYLNIMRSIERVLISTGIYSISLLINVCLNWLLIFGNLGAPKMGIRGAALATLTARISEMLMAMLYAHFRNRVVKIRLQYILHPDGVLMKDYLTYSLPVVLNEVMWGLGSSANTAIIGHLGSPAVAANSVAQMAKQLAQVVTLGVANATAIYLGKTIGEHKIELAKSYSKRFIWLSIGLGILGALIILCAIPLARSGLALSNEAKNYLGFMFFVMAYFTIAQSYNGTMIIGIFRSGGDTRFGLFMDVSTMWGFSIILGALAAFVFHAPVKVVYAILMCDELIKVPMGTLRYKQYKWLRDVTRQ